MAGLGGEEGGEERGEQSGEPRGACVWIVRHGERADVDPAWERTAPRPHDPPLTPHGRAQAAATARALAGRDAPEVINLKPRDLESSFCQCVGWKGTGVRCEGTGVWSAAELDLTLCAGTTRVS